MRRFIGSMVVGLVACALASCLVPAIAVADGYQYAGKWGSRGTGNGQFDGIGGIAIAGSGNVYVSDLGNKRIEKFSASGAYLGQWGTLGASPEGVAVDRSGNVYVADYWGGRILKFSSSGTSLAQFDTTIAGDTWGSEPHSIAVDASGNIWVADSGDLLVKKFSSSGTYLGRLGTEGSGPGQLEFPVGVAVDPSNNVYVVDCTNYTVQKFTSGGTYLDGRTTICSGDANLLYPVHVAVDGAGNTYVADTYSGTLFSDASVKKFDSSFVFQTRIGVYSGSAALDGTFCSVRGIAVGASGKVYLADTTYDRVVEFTPAAVVPAPTVTLKLSGLRSGALKLGKRVTAKGRVTPTSLAGSKVKLSVQKKKGAKWVTVKSTSRTIGVSGAYSWKYKPAKRGAYRMRATVAKTTAHTAAATPWRKFKVK